MSADRVTWVVGGPQGSGVDSAATIYARALAEGKLQIYGEREYYSNIKGEHSYYTVVASEGRVRSRPSSVHVLATFDEETIVKHAFDVVKGGAIIYDPQVENTLLSQIPTLEAEAVGRVLARLGRKEEEGKVGEVSVKEVLSYAESAGSVLAPVPYSDLTMEVGHKLGVDPGRLTRSVNVMAVASSLSLVGYPLEFLEAAIQKQFSGKAAAANENVAAARASYEYASRFRPRVSFTLGNGHNSEQRVLLQGTQAVALGKIAAGGRFQSYYPISPATDESFFLEEYETFGRGNTSSDYFIVVQSEDEIAAVTMAIGASLAGVRSSTATSGPGFSLMMEGIGWAGINEVPLVITLYQRGGPSTGLPTRSEQADLLFALNAGHGDFPKIVFASGDIEECFYDAGKAFNYAEKYQMPVIHLVEKQLATGTVTIPPFDLSKVNIERGKLLSGSNGPFRRFKITEDGVSPRSILGQEGGVGWYTGDEHDEFGHITEDPDTRKRMMEKRMRKLELAAREIPLQDKMTYYGPSRPDHLIVGWGGTKGPALDALDILSARGFSVGFLQLKMMQPFPSDEVTKVIDSAGEVISVESNFTGQLAQLIAQKTGHMIKRQIHKYTGRPIGSDELVEALNDMFREPDRRLEVLTVGA
ncbi:MAG: 2-oxoacid:acceptor oxidoreductase subunit alpha [Nitrososphaerota archaeon]|nr:2-oxoacid:acceptor oxidoreductase subunit alpha [Nitrososphaerota archaeon]